MTKLELIIATSVVAILVVIAGMNSSRRERTRSQTQQLHVKRWMTNCVTSGKDITLCSESRAKIDRFLGNPPDVSAQARIETCYSKGASLEDCIYIESKYHTATR